MVKSSWGTKRTCKKCSANFYDLANDPIVCPKCSTSFTVNDFISKYAKSSEKIDQKRDKKILDDAPEDILDDNTIVNTDLLEDSEDLDEDLDIIDRDAVEDDQ